MKGLQILSIMLFFYVTSMAQWVQRGVIVDRQTKNKLSNVEVWAENGNKTFSDEKGYFEIVLLEKCEKITLNHLAYFMNEVRMCEQPKGEVISFQMQMRTYNIAEVDVKPFSVADYFRLFYANVANNYVQKKGQARAVFIEEISQDDSLVLGFEAQCLLNRYPYSLKKKDQIRFDYAELKRFDRSAFVWKYLVFIDAPYELVASDVARFTGDFIVVPQNKLNFLDIRYLKYYRYEIVGSDDEYVKIDFFPRIGKSVFGGEIVFDAKTMALVGLEYWYDERMKMRPELSRHETVDALAIEGVFMEDVSYYSKIEYEKSASGWFLSFAEIRYCFWMFDKNNSEEYKVCVMDKMKVVDFVLFDWDKFSFRERVKWGVPMRYQVK